VKRRNLRRLHLAIATLDREDRQKCYGNFHAPNDSAVHRLRPTEIVKK
jgi:hypothetical protein